MCGWCQRVCGAEESRGVSGGIGGSGTDAAGGFFGRDAAADGLDAEEGKAGLFGSDAAGREAAGDVNHQVPTKSAPRIKPIMRPLVGDLGVGSAEGGVPEIRAVDADSLEGRVCVGRLRTWVADAACSADACTKISEVLS